MKPVKSDPQSFAPRTSTEIQQLKELDRSVVWHAFSQMHQYDGLIIESASGNWLHSIDGRRYLDGASSLWCNVHGHCHPVINEAIERQLGQVSHVTGLGMSHPETIRLAQRLVQLSPNSLNHVFFCSDGACAVEVAMKIAFQYWRQCEKPNPRKTKFVALGSAYHGDTIGTVALGGVEQFHSLFKPLLFPVLRGPCPAGRSNQNLAVTQTTLPESSNGNSEAIQGDASSLCDRYLNAYRHLMLEHADEIAGVVVEPLLQCSAGMVFHPPGFLAGIAELCKEFNTLLIVDEIAVGMGRTGDLFVSDREQVQPDLLCIGKGLTGGYLPMSAALTSSKIFDAFLGGPDKTLYHGHTYGGNALSAAAANATLDLTIDRIASPEFASRIHQLEDGLARLALHPSVARVDQLGLLGVVELKSRDSDPQSSIAMARKTYLHMLEHEVWLRPLGNTIPIVPPLSISEDELTLMLSALGQAIALADTENVNL